MRFAVLGTTGLIGAAVAQRLSRDGEVVSIGRRDAELFADLSKPESFARLDLAPFDAVVHCAGIVDEDFKENPDRALVQAGRGMSALVARSREAHVTRFVYISSVHVYGPLAGMIDERTPANPLSDYALAHYMSEQILRRMTGPTFCGAAFRPCAVFGMPPDLSRFRRWGLAPFEFPRSAVTQRVITLKSSGRMRRNFVGAEDVADAVARWLSDPAPAPMSVINPVGKESLSILELAKLCADAAKELIGRPVTVTCAASNDDAAAAAPLEYVTVFPEYRGTQDLQRSVRTLIGRLLEEEAGGQR